MTLQVVPDRIANGTDDRVVRLMMDTGYWVGRNETRIAQLQIGNLLSIEQELGNITGGIYLRGNNV